MAGKKKELLLHIMSIYSVGFEPEISVGTSLLTLCGGHYMPPPHDWNRVNSPKYSWKIVQRIQKSH